MTWKIGRVKSHHVCVHQVMRIHSLYHPLIIYKKPVLRRDKCVYNCTWYTRMLAGNRRNRKRRKKELEKQELERNRRIIGNQTK